MVRKFCCVSLLGALLLPQLPVSGQSVKEVQSQSFDRAPDKSGPAKNTPDLERVKEEIVSSTNQFRRQQGQRELKVNQQLAKAAQYFADYMAQTDKYSHTADGKEPWERAAKYDYAYCIVLENIAYEYSPEGFRTNDLARAFMDGWKKSPPHRKNLLDPDTYDIGVGVAHSSRTGRYYAVQNFGRPKSKEIVFKITNETDSPVKSTVDGKESSIDPRYTITYEQCRPPEVRIQVPTETTTLHPRNGGHYVIRKDESGKFTVDASGP
jgi:uncharacterized protein YkwD